MKQTITFELTENAKRRTPEDFAVSNQPIPVAPFPDVGDFVAFAHGEAAFEFKVVKRQFNYLPSGELVFVVQVD